MSEHVTIIMIEDDEGHALLIERNIRRAGVTTRSAGRGWQLAHPAGREAGHRRQ